MSFAYVYRMKRTSFNFKA